MTVYYALLLTPIVLQPLIGNHRKLYRNTMFCLLFLILALRDFSVGGDLESYTISYNFIFRTRLLDVYQEYQTEPFFLLFNKVCGVLSNGSFRFFLMVSALVFSGFLAQIIYENSKRQWLSWFIFIAFGYLPYGFALIRASFALIIGTYFLKFLVQSPNELQGSNKSVFYIGEICATLFHYTGLVFFLIAPMQKIRKRKQYYLVYISLCGLLFIFGGVIVEFLAKIFFPSKEYEFTSSGGIWLLLMILIIRIMVAIIVPKKHKDDKYQLFVVLLELGIMSQIVTYHFSLWSRITNLIVFYPFILLPNYLLDVRLDRAGRWLIHLGLIMIGILMFSIQMNADAAEMVPYLLAW